MPENVKRINLDGKELILIGTAHVSPKSVEQVKAVIDTEKPDSVCVELDKQRYETIMDRNRWKNMDIFQVIKKKKATFLLMNLVISSFQKRLAKQFGIKPGQEMIQGIESARENGAHLVLADRDLQVTFARIWHGLGLWGKAKLLTSIIFSIFNTESISEEELEKMKSEDMLSAMLSEFSTHFPELKTPLIDERDQYLSQKIKNAPGKKIVAILGAAHVPGVIKEIHREHDLDSLASVPPRSRLPKIAAWLIPIFILSVIGYSFYANPTIGILQSISWILWNGSLSAIGAAVAFGHPLAIITAFVVSPLSSLNPLIAAGWFAGLVQAYICRPSVEVFENLSEDVFTIKGFWTNKVTRILLVVCLTNIGSTIGTIFGGADVIRLFLENL